VPRLRHNARRTWPQDGCEQRPLHPHKPRCPGWGWVDAKGGGVLVGRCESCRIFDDDTDASEHVNRCQSCQELIEEQQIGRDERKRQRDADRLNMPDERERRALLRYFEIQDVETGLWEGSNKSTIAQFLEETGAGIYEFPSAAAAWWKLYEWAGEDYDGPAWSEEDEDDD
jgi:hypothetical protein